LKTLLSDLVTDIRMLFRVPVSAFFTVVFPSLMLIIMMASYGNPDIGSGIRLSDKYVLIASGMGLAPSLSSPSPRGSALAWRAPTSCA
jgi:ABC transporter